MTKTKTFLHGVWTSCKLLTHTVSPSPVHSKSQHLPTLSCMYTRCYHWWVHDAADWLSLQVLIEKGTPAPSPLMKCFELEIHKINVIPLIHRGLFLVAYSLGVILASVGRVLSMKWGEMKLVTIQKIFTSWPSGGASSRKLNLRLLAKFLILRLALSVSADLFFLQLQWLIVKQC